MIYVQFRGVADKDLEQFRSAGKQVIVAPDAFKTGEVDSVQPGAEVASLAVRTASRSRSSRVFCSAASMRR